MIRATKEQVKQLRAGEAVELRYRHIQPPPKGSTQRLGMEGRAVDVRVLVLRVRPKGRVTRGTIRNWVLTCALDRQEPGLYIPRKTGKGDDDEGNRDYTRNPAKADTEAGEAPPRTWLEAEATEKRARDLDLARERKTRERVAQEWKASVSRAVKRRERGRAGREDQKAA